VAAYEQAQTQARGERVGIWVYGDVASDDARVCVMDGWLADCFFLGRSILSDLSQEFGYSGAKK
jgi:hypothetical protein